MRIRHAFTRACVLLAGISAVPASPLQPGADLRGLPLTEVPARGTSRRTLVVLLTGDGGWADLDRRMAEVLSDSGVAVIGLDSRAYLSTRRTPEQVASDVARIATAYATKWRTERLALVGYSRGASLIPFVANRLPPLLRERLVLLAMLGLPTAANFQFHWLDIARDVRRPDDQPVQPELQRLAAYRTLCVFGTKEASSACRDSRSLFTTVVARDGDHHFDGNYRALGLLVLDGLRSRAAKSERGQS